MKNMTLTKIAEVCGGKLYNEYPSEREVEGVVLDSRQVEKDYLFIATAGERVDGHDFIAAAYEKGAMAVVCERPPVGMEGSYIHVNNSLEALKELAKWYRMQLSVKVIGITGSVGKTSTKEFISSVLSQKYTVLKTEGNYNNEIGLPLTVLKIRSEHEVAVVEMGISHFGEMHRLSEIAKPDIAVITNIGQCHLEYLGSRSGILKAKTEIFDSMGKDAGVILNGDDDMLSTIDEVKGKKPLRFGMADTNEIYATDIISKGLFGSTCDIHISDGVFRAEIPLPGEHMVQNALAAASAGTLLGLTPEEIAAGIRLVKPLGGRSNIIRMDKFTIIDDCYNANPISMNAAIDLLSMADTRRVAILGDMGELGEHENSLHRKVGAYAAAAGLEVLVCVGRLAKDIYEGAKASGDTGLPALFYFATKDALESALPAIIHENDTVLVKASHSMGFDNIVNALKRL